MKIGDHIVSVRTQIVGPHHDPYQNESLSVSRVVDGHKYEAYWLVASLGRDVFELKLDGQVVRHEEHYPDVSVTPKERGLYAKWKILFRRHVGLHPDEAKHAYDTGWSMDPMGSPSMYK